MARINVEDSWWIDPRRSALVRLLGGDEEKADGAAVRLWRVGQNYWKNGHQPIPKHCFDLLPCASELLASAMVVVEGASVYVRGASTHFEWMDKKRLAGSLGGKKSVESRRLNQGTAQPTRKIPEAPPKQLEADRTKIKHFEPSYSSSFSPSFSNSVSILKKESVKKEKPGIRMDYPEEFESVWKLYGKFGTDKKKALIEYQKLHLSEEERSNLTIAIINYKIKKTELEYRKDFENFLKTDWRVHLNLATDTLGANHKTQAKVDQYERYIAKDAAREKGGNYES